MRKDETTGSPGADSSGLPPAGRRSEILAVGREILQGRTLDSNSHWLAGRLTAGGWSVGRMTVVDDDTGEIAAAARDSLRRDVRLVVTTGGLGPTADDRTLAGVASAAGVPLVLHPAALEMVRQFYAHLAAQGAVRVEGITAERRKMALLPQGSVPLRNPTGAAPGCLLDVSGATVISLPGVPGEMKSLFESEVEPLLATVFTLGCFLQRVIEVKLGDESELSPLLDRLRAEFPDMHVKSLAGRFAKGHRLSVVLSASGPDEPRLERRLAQAAVRLRQLASG